MLNDFIATTISGNMGFAPTTDQTRLIAGLASFIMDTQQTRLFLVKGYAGTGKTTVVSALVKSFDFLKVKTVLLAPTGRAAKVLSFYSKRNAYTIHKHIYRQKGSTDGFGKFQLDKNLHTNTLFIVDEASMISNSSGENSIFGTGRLLDDLYTYVYSGHNCKLILIGDTAQLPPVRLHVSPALDAAELKRLFYVEVTEMLLREVVRQSDDSGILYNATKLRNMLPEKATEGNKVLGFPKLELRNFPDVHRIAGQDLIEEISTSYDKYSMEDTIVLCRSNKRANRYNAGIRSSILYREEEISTGDFLMVVKNNYFWLEGYENTDFIANGDIVEIVRISGYEEMYGYRFANITVRFLDYDDIEADVKIILNTLTIEAPSLSEEDNRKLFFSIAEDYQDVASKRERYNKVKINEYFNALQVKFAYAVTCHKAQGGQWRSVFVDQGFLPDNVPDTDYIRWLYTAMTRATEHLYLVNFSDDFFEDK